MPACRYAAIGTFPGSEAQAGLVPDREWPRWLRLARMLLPCLLLLLMMMALTLHAAAAERLSLEERIKAASLHRFLGYVEWPPAAFASAASPYVIGIAGSPGIADELERISAARLVNNRAVTVRTVKAGEPLDGLHVLFIGRSESARLERWLGAAQQKPILAVTEEEGALGRGSMINFRLAEERVRFEVALDAAEKAGLRISARMLSVALSVSKGEGR